MTLSLGEKQCDFTFMVARLIMQACALGYEIKVQEWNRLLETQKEYVAKGVSKTLNSKHLDNLAVDIYLYKAGKVIMGGEDYRALGEYWEGLRPGVSIWGGRWGAKEGQIGFDPVHFQYGA
mgnify:FL=1